MLKKRLVSLVLVCAMIVSIIGGVSVSVAAEANLLLEDDFEGTSSLLEGKNCFVVADGDSGNHYLEFSHKTAEDYAESTPNYGMSREVKVASMPLNFALTADIYQEADNTEPFVFEYYADDFDGDGVSDAFGSTNIAQSEMETGVWYHLSLKKISGTAKNGVFKATLTNKETGEEKMVIPTYYQNISRNTTYNRFMFRARNRAGSMCHWRIDNLRIEENFDFELPSRIMEVDAAYPTRRVEAEGLMWRFVDHVTGTVDDKTTADKFDDEIIDAVVTPTAYVNDDGNVVVSIQNDIPLRTNTPYGAYVYSADNAGDGEPFDPKRFTDNHDLETRIKFDSGFYIMYYTGKYRFYLAFLSDSVMQYNDKDNESRSIEMDLGYGNWIDLKLSVREQKWGTISVNGKEIITYELPKAAILSPYVQYSVYKEGMPVNLEIDSVKVTPVATDGFNIDSITNRDSYNEGGSITLKTNLSDENCQASYYINGIMVGKDEMKTQSSVSGDSATNIGLTIPKLKAGIYDIFAEANGAKTPEKRIFVGLGADAEGEAASNGEREYILEYEYDGKSANNVIVNDGYFTFDFSHDGNEINYRALNNDNAMYSGIENGIGAGKYKAVVTAGYAEIYYNDQFLFSTFLPYTYNESSAARFVHSGLRNVSKNPSGVKKEHYHMDWDGREELADYGMNFSRFYSAEFDKLDKSDDKILIYDGEYQVNLTFDERGITAETQNDDYSPTKEFRLAESFETGYYRITVAMGLAQLFRNNEFIHSFKCPSNNHSDAVFRKIGNPDGSTFVAIKDTDDIYFHNEDFENKAELNPLDYWYSERESMVLAEGEEDPFVQEIVTEGDNSYLKITDMGIGDYLVPETSLDAEPVADFNLNVSADSPNLTWRAKADGKGAIHFLGRHTQRGVFLSFGYDFDTKEWILAEHDRMSGEDKYYDGNKILAKKGGSLDDKWHRYELVMNGGAVALRCDGNTVLSYSGLENAHGKVGFGVSKGAALSVDDIVYSGEGKVSPGFTYHSVSQFGSKDFFYSPKYGGVMAASSNANSLLTKDGGKTWESVNGGFGNTSLNLLSGGFMNVGYGSTGWNLYRTYSGYYPAKAWEYWGNGNRMINGIWGKSNLLIEPDWYDDMGYGRSIMPSRLVQVQDGKYKGRVFMSRDVGNSETYGMPVLFYTDADIHYDPNDTSYYDGTTNKTSTSKLYPVEWTQSETSFFYSVTGINGQEPLTVDMPNDVIRFFIRNDCGFLYYADSFDGGANFGKLQPSQLIAPLCCYGIMRDPANLNHYYAYFQYDANTFDKSKTGGRPRTRGVLAVSYDGMKNWHMVMDVEELKDDWSISNTPMNHGMRVIDGVVYFCYTASQNYARFMAVDTAKVKPMLRFSQLHEKVQVYDNVAGRVVNESCIIPKTGGIGKLYGKTVDIVTENGNYSKDVIEDIFGATEKSTGIFDFLGAEISITADENGNYDIVDAASAFSTNVTETETAYVISRWQLPRAYVHQFEGMGVRKTFDEDMKSLFLNYLNNATSYGLAEDVKRHISDFREYLTVDVDSVDTSKLMGTTFYSVEQLDNILKGTETFGAVYVSTPVNGFEDWMTLASENALTVKFSDDAATVENNGFFESGDAFGTATELPDSYTVEFSVKPCAGSETVVHMGNGKHRVQFGLDTGDGLASEDMVNIELLPDVRTTFVVSVAGDTAEVTYVAENGEEQKVTVDASNKASDCGLWFSALEGKFDLKDVRVFRGTKEKLDVGFECVSAESVEIPECNGKNVFTRVSYAQNPPMPQAEGESVYMMVTFEAKNAVKGMPLAIHTSGGGVGSEFSNNVSTVSILGDGTDDGWYSYKLVTKAVYGVRDMENIAVYRKKVDSDDEYEQVEFVNNNGGRISSGVGNIRFGYRANDEKFAQAGSVLSETQWEVRDVKVICGGAKLDGYITRDGRYITAEFDLNTSDTSAEPVLALYDKGRFVGCDSNFVNNGEGRSILWVDAEDASDPELRLFVWKSLDGGVSNVESMVIEAFEE